MAIDIMAPGSVATYFMPDDPAALEIERVAGLIASPVASGALRLAAARLRGDESQVTMLLLHLLDLLSVDLQRAGRPLAQRELVLASTALRHTSRQTQDVHQLLQHAALADILEVAAIRATLNEPPRAASAAALALRAVCDADALAHAQLVELIELTRAD
jgi:hypothetical protein